MKANLQKSPFLGLALLVLCTVSGCRNETESMIQTLPQAINPTPVPSPVTENPVRTAAVFTMVIAPLLQ